MALTNITVSREYGFGIAKQSVETTFVTPTNFLAVKSMSMPMAKEFIDASGARGTNEVLANDYLEGLISYSGEVSFPAIPRFFTTLLEGAYGDKTTNAGVGTNMNVFLHKNDPNRLSISGNFGRRNINWTGCVVTDLELSSSSGADLVATARFMGLSATYTSTATATGAKALRTQRAFQHKNIVLTVYGTSLPISDFSLNIARPNVNPFYGNAIEAANLIVERPTEVTGKATLPWSTEAYDLFSNFNNFTSGQITAHYTRGTNQLRFTMPQVVITDAPMAPLSDMAVSSFELSWKALAPTNQDSVKIELTASA
jgi:hypothetical protein